MNGRRDAVLFAVAAAIAVLAGIAFRDAFGYAVHGPNGLEGDIQHYVYWTRLVTLGGIQSAYSGTWPETYAVYAPMPLYGYQVVGNLYRALQDPAFDPVVAQGSLWLRAGIKMTALLWHLGAGLAIYGTVRASGRGRWAAPAAALYLANPAALFDVTYWGQPDGAQSLFAVLAIGGLEAGQRGRSWASMGLAAMVKPQAWVVAPLVALATYRSHGWRGLAGGLGIAAGVLIVVVAPFLVAGRLGDLLTLPGAIADVLPAISADAHNFWWLVAARAGVDPVRGAIPGLELSTLRAIAGLLVGLVFAFTAWLFWTRRVRLAEAAALSVLGWFLFTTQAHENHLFLALPLFALAWPGRPRLSVAFAALSLTALMNLALHDLTLLESLGLRWDDAAVRRLRHANALANLVVFAVWATWAVTRRPIPDDYAVSASR